MIEENEPLGNLVKCLLIHMKIIEIRMDFSTHAHKGHSKYKINQSVNKVKSAINDICNLCSNKEVVKKIKNRLENVDLVYHMTLAEQLYDVNEETLRDITDMIDDYLLKKLNSNECKENQMGEGNVD